MNCHKNDFNGLLGKSTIYVCVEKGPEAHLNYFNVSLKGQPGEKIPVSGYIEFILEEAPEGRDVWIQKSRHFPPTLWENSLFSDKTGTLNRSGGPNYTRILAKIYSDKERKYLIGTVSTNPFYA